MIVFRKQIVSKTKPLASNRTLKKNFISHKIHWDLSLFRLWHTSTKRTIKTKNQKLNKHFAKKTVWRPIRQCIKNLVKFSYASANQSFKMLPAVNATMKPVDRKEQHIEIYKKNLDIFFKIFDSKANKKFSYQLKLVKGVLFSSISSR